MPIEFHCPGCGKRMRTPDETANRKGKCPSCGIKVNIPDRSLVASSSSAVMETSSVPASVSTELSCGGCGVIVQVTDSMAGTKAPCPTCGAVLPIPDAATLQALRAATKAGKQRWREAKQPDTPTRAAKPAKIDFSCPQCGHSVAVPLSYAGKKGQCPKCKTVVRIPS